MKNITSDKIKVKVQDGTEMQIYIAKPKDTESSEKKRLPGLIVFQEIFGINAHIRDVTERFAAEGYFSVAPELFHRTAPPGFELDYHEMEQGMSHAKSLTEDNLISDIQATRHFLQNQIECDPNSLSSIGFCFGGKISFLANSFLPLKAAISFYGGGIASELLHLSSKQQGPLLSFWGGSDSHITMADRRAIQDALYQEKKDFAYVEFSNAGHGFFCDKRESYNPKAAKEAWALTLEFLKNRC